MRPRPFVHDTGLGPALVLLHAFPLDASQWDHQVAAWSGRYRCLRPDMYGCGRSPLPEGVTVSLEGYAAALLDTLDALGVNDFGCVGASMGGYVALALLALAPARVRALVLVGSAATADTPGRRRERQGIADRVMAEGLEFLASGAPDTALGPRARAEAHIVDPLRGRVRGWTPGAVAAVEQALLHRPARTDLLAALRVPTMVVGGGEDRLTPPPILDALAAQVPGAARHTFPGQGHLCNLEDPHQFSAAVGDFLDVAVPQP
ncbi:MAG: alpha/beta fold hydrolase [Candidatus Dormibacteria bacterium]